VLTLQRNRVAYGYFAGARFMRRTGELADEIALNPAHFAAQPIEATLSTLVHEQVHQWQHHHGKPGRRGYHNKQWALRMWTIGLVPSDTGAPGGRRTGERMSHYIQAGGAFARACAELVVQPFTIHWLDRAAALSQASPDTQPSPARLGTRVKYRCQTCAAQAWGKPGLALLCGTCNANPLEPVQG